MRGNEGRDNKHRPLIFLGMGFYSIGAEGGSASMPPEAEMLAAHGMSTTN